MDSYLLLHLDRHGDFAKKVATILVLLVVLAAGFYLAMRPSIVYWNLVTTVSDEVYSFYQKRPPNVDAKQWEEAVGWTMNIIGNVTMMTDECDLPFLQKFHISLQKKAADGVALDTLKWIWDELAKVGPRAADYAYGSRPVHLMASEPITDETLQTLWGIDDCRELNLFGAQISNQGLVHLKRLRRVEFIYLDSVNLTEEGIIDLQKALPHCEVVHVGKPR